MRVWGKSCLSRAARGREGELVPGGGQGHGLESVFAERSEATCGMLSGGLSGMAGAGGQVLSFANAWSFCVSQPPENCAVGLQKSG